MRWCSTTSVTSAYSTQRVVSSSQLRVAWDDFEDARTIIWSFFPLLNPRLFFSTSRDDEYEMYGERFFLFLPAWPLGKDEFENSVLRIDSQNESSFFWVNGFLNILWVLKKYKSETLSKHRQSLCFSILVYIFSGLRPIKAEYKGCLAGCYTVRCNIVSVEACWWC